MSGALFERVLRRNMDGRRAAVTQFAEEARPHAIRENKDYKEALRANSHSFRKRNGVFTHTYDAAHRYGISKPFQI